MNVFGFNNASNSKRVASQTYVVKKGDSMYKIAQKYSVSLNELMQANHLTSTLIYPDQVIVIPMKIPAGAMYFEEYVIKHNDTIAEIANKLNVPVEVITKYNDITKLIILEGQSLVLPIRNEAYKISSADNLYTILSRFGLTIEELVNMNASKWLAIGQEIIVK